jgi:hypothetical protein
MAVHWDIEGNVKTFLADWQRMSSGTWIFVDFEEVPKEASGHRKITVPGLLSS